jgi:polysaccharide export outer membrane protein
MLLLSACGGGAVKRTAISANPPTPSSAPPGSQPAVDGPGAPTFQKVAPEDNPALAPAAPGVGAGSANPYQLEIEDQLDISVYDEKDLQHVEVPVRPDGMISFAFIGDVSAAGRTVEEVRTEMTEKLGRFLRSPQVTVIAKGFAQKKVFIGGEVKTPGIFYLSGKEGTLLDALYKAGLTTDKADLEGAYLMRSNKVVNTNFKQLVRGDTASNVRLMDQDMIYIPENTRRFIYVLGEVRNATALETLEPIPIIRALTQAGWMNLGAKKREIAVLRGGLKAPEIAVVDAKALVQGDLSQNIFVQPGDIIYVSPGPLGKFNYVIDTILRAISPIVQATIVSNTVNPTRPDPSPNN